MNLATAAAEDGGPMFVLSAIVSVQVMAAIAGLVVVTWPLLMDPCRDQLATRDVLRQGVMVLTLRPAAAAGLVVIELLLLLAQVTVVATAFVLPSVMLLLAAFAVLPRADRLCPPVDWSGRG